MRVNFNYVKSFYLQKVAGLLYLGLLVFCGLIGAHRGLSYYYADRAKASGSVEEITAALKFAPSNPEIYKVGGLVSLEAKDFSAASKMLEDAVKLRKNDYLLWLRLGYARYKLGNREGADIAYRRSLELAPFYAPPKRFLGHLLLKTGETEKAFRYLSQAVEINPELRLETFRLARKQFPGEGEAIERAVASELPALRKDLFFYLIKHSLVTESMEKHLTADTLSDGEKGEFVRALIEKKDFNLAREIWLTQKNRRLLLNRQDDELILDGGFEQIVESDEIGFGWKINQKLSAAGAALDETVKESGNQSLRIVLNGKTEVQASILSQTALLEPGQTYVLSFSALVAEIVSAGGLSVDASDAATGQTLGGSEPLKSSSVEWNRYQFSFTAPESTAAVIALRRLPCRMNPCPIFADLRLDNFSLKKSDR